jgi:antitoxin (DNA-binding transcriptional repressor) of toxin-antitoxin stability system
MLPPPGPLRIAWGNAFLRLAFTRAPQPREVHAVVRQPWVGAIHWEIGQALLADDPDVPSLDSDTKSDNLILMPKTISATEAARSFADVLTRVSQRGEEFIVERAGEPVCRISPVGPAIRSTAGDLARAVAAISWPDAEYFAILKDLLRKQDKISMEDPWAR